MTTISAGALYNGTIIAGAGVVSETRIREAIPGTTGGIERCYSRRHRQPVDFVQVDDGRLRPARQYAATITGTFGVGDVLSGTGVTAGTTITALGTGTGERGKPAWYRRQNRVDGHDHERDQRRTNWYVDSFAAAGELAMISTRG